MPRGISIAVGQKMLEPVTSRAPRLHRRPYVCWMNWAPRRCRDAGYCGDPVGFHRVQQRIFREVIEQLRRGIHLIAAQFWKSTKFKNVSINPFLRLFKRNQTLCDRVPMTIETFFLNRVVQ